MIFENTNLDIQAVRDRGMLPFYESIVTSWASMQKQELTPDNVRNQNLYFNCHITKKDGSSIFYPDLAKLGINKINDLVKDGRLICFGEAHHEKRIKTFECYTFIIVELT